MAVAMGTGGWLAWHLIARSPRPEPTPAPATAPSSPPPVEAHTPPAHGGTRPSGRSKAACVAPRQFEPAPKPFIVVEESQGDQRWYLRCPRPMQQVDGTAALVRFQDGHGRTGLGVQPVGGRGEPSGLRSVLELEDLAAVNAEVLGCATLEPSAGPRAWVSVQRPDRSRVIHALRWQDGQLELDGLTPALEATEPWMKDRLWEPAVFRHGDTWLMYLRCGSRTHADLCVASSTDGDHWSMEPHRLLDVEARKNEVYGAPWASSDGERVHLWFSHKRYETDDDGAVINVESEIHHLSSTDPLSFELHYRSVSLAPGFADWAETMVDTPTVMTIDGRTAMLYRGGASAKDGVIGVAWGDCSSKQHITPELNTKSLKSTRREQNAQGE